MDFCIVIRTLLIKNGTVYFQAGAGIVADSQPDNELQETVNKARALVKALQMVKEGIE
jgi:anthranilate synthase component 1